MTAKEYRRLPGMGRQAYGHSRLYLGRDHLLKLTNVAGVEEYKRFYYADIEAVVVQRTRSYEVGLVAWTFLMLLCWAAYFPLLSAAHRGALGVAAIILLVSVATIVHLLLGPTCKVRLRTAVHEEPLTNLTRMRTFRRVLARLSPELERAQAGIALEEIPSQPASKSVNPFAAASSGPVASQPEQPTSEL